MQTTAQGAVYDSVNNGVVTSVDDGGGVEYDHFEVYGKMTAGFAIRELAGKVKKGDSISVFIHGGSLISQININGTPVHWKTPEQEHADHEAWKKRKDEEDKARFAEAKADLDADYAALPVALQRRLDVFRKYCPTDFRVKYEGYEMTCLKDAVKLAGIPKDAADKDAIWAWYKKFSDMGYTAQQGILQNAGVELDPGLSGNQFGMLVRLAAYLETDPDMAFQYHGAMTPLTGCVEYGCPHPRRLTDDGYWVDDEAWEKSRK